MQLVEQFYKQIIPEKKLKKLKQHLNNSLLNEYYYAIDLYFEVPGSELLRGTTH